MPWIASIDVAELPFLLVFTAFPARWFGLLLVGGTRRHRTTEICGGQICGGLGRTGSAQRIGEVRFRR
jgi:hypothetical protein